MPRKMSDETLDQAFGLPEVLVAVRTSCLSCKTAGKPRTLMPVWDSSGESRRNGSIQDGLSKEVCDRARGEGSVVENRCVLHWQEREPREGSTQDPKACRAHGQAPVPALRGRQPIPARRAAATRPARTVPSGMCSAG